MNQLATLEAVQIGKATLVHADCFSWLRAQPEQSIHAIVTDPPYGVKEYEVEEMEKLRTGKAGIWRLPPAYDGNVRAPLPRFTALNPKELATLREFFVEWARFVVPVLKPGAHVFVASNSFLSQMVFAALIEGGLEFRTEIIRLVQTLRGGDRPKLGEEEFHDVCALPRGSYEPWGLFRKPMPPKMTVRECLREHGTGGLRRIDADRPFFDVIQSERTPRAERDIADHPSLKPQSLMRQLVRASLPLGQGVVLDPFMGGGSTIAAAEAVGYNSVGVERDSAFFRVAVDALPRLAGLGGKFQGKLDLGDL
ncbi:MAG: site-specific DNA-methyltransferase [Rhodobacteraceae bacterium]|nr:site-specific DNA-methyltransferase [Paracoccaceae bacterium]MCZ8084983.1 site-specific DNA-methyltransferase [Paracoccaceae bacterium]